MSDKNSENKYLTATTGSMDGNTWTGQTDEVTFMSSYVSSQYSSKTSYYYGLSNMKITVANPTGIEQLKAERFIDNRIYNMMGVEMDEHQLAPGIYIKNGRKFVVK